MMRRAKMVPAQAQEIERALEASQGEITDLLSAASHQLSRFSHQVGVVLVPEVRRIVIEHFEFVRLDPRRVVAILVGRSGVVHNRILDIAEAIDQPSLDRVGRYLTQEFGGRTVPEIREKLREQVLAERAAYDRLVARGIELGRKTLEAEPGDGEVIVDGAANLLESPEFADPEKLRGLMQALDHKQTLIALLGRVLEDEGVQVVIGEDPSETGLPGCSLVASSYGAGNRVMGTLGIVGPTRMEYAQAIALVDHLAQVLNRYFSGASSG
jgi:heat-inducible transcriptional repressor